MNAYTAHTHASTPARRTTQTADWIVMFDASCVPVLSAHARAAVADHLAEALVRDYRNEHGPKDGLRLVPPGESTVDETSRVADGGGRGRTCRLNPFGELAPSGPKVAL